MDPFEDDRIQPTDITAEASTRTLAIRWLDGHHSAYGWEWLRWRCPCAECQGEMGIPGKLQSTERLTAEQTELTNVVLVGAYGLQLYWADGHSYGIYSFQWLRAACPCQECTGKRAARKAE